jgi:hypothetical protein
LRRRRGRRRGRRMRGDADINGERDWQAEQPGYHR